MQTVHLLLQRPNMGRHVLVLLRVLEAIAAVRRIHAVEVEVAAALAWCLAVTFDLASLALLECSAYRLELPPMLHTSLQAIEMYRLRFALS